MQSDGIFLTNRCSACGRALTKLEVLDALANDHRLCPCGSDRMRSSNFKWWEALLLPRSWKLFWAWKTGRVAPPPTPESIKASNSRVIKRATEIASEVQ